MLVEAAPAKLNLYLHLLGRRDDGYHLLDSLVAFASVGDRVVLTPAETAALSVDGPFAAAMPAGEGNLAMTAARALAEALDRPRRFAIRLTKNLPVAAGIGGGSADAAAVLRALARLWEIQADDPRLFRVAAGLGADVPVCLYGRPAFVGGIGERIDPAPSLGPAPVVLVNPGTPLPTPSVFRARQGSFSQPARFAEAAGGAAGLARLLAARSNDLTAAARALCPAVGTVLAALASTPGCLLARMSGSGATCFGLYESDARAAAAAAALGAAEPGWWVSAGRLL